MKCANVPAPLPDECLRSFGYRVFDENTHSVKTVENLLKNLHQITGMSISDLLANHTNLSYYRFVSSKFFGQEIARHPDISTNRMVNSGAMFSRVSKFCQECIKDDFHVHGISYWKRLHQLPGVNHCSIHFAPLYIARSSDLIRFSPYQVSRIYGCVSVISEEEMYGYFNSEIIRRFARLSESVLNQRFSFKHEHIVEVFRVRYKKISSEKFFTFYRNRLVNLPAAWCLDLTKRKEDAYSLASSLERLVNTRSQTMLTQMYILVMAMLWENPDEALAECMKNLKVNKEDYITETANKALNEVLSGASITSACKKHCVRLEEFDVALQKFLRNRSDLKTESV